MKDGIEVNPKLDGQGALVAQVMQQRIDGLLRQTKDWGRASVFISVVTHDEDAPLVASGMKVDEDGVRKDLEYMLRNVANSEESKENKKKISEEIRRQADNPRKMVGTLICKGMIEAMDLHH